MVVKMKCQNFEFKFMFIVCIRQSANAGRKAVKIVQEPANYGGL